MSATTVRAILLVLGLVVVWIIVSPRVASTQTSASPMPTIVASATAATTTPTPPAPPTSTATSAPTTATTSCQMQGGLPDRSCTPGVANPAVTQANIASTICVSGYTTTIRPPATYTNALKIDQMKLYGLTDLTPADVEEDHLIALEIGGDPRDARNLWPEPRAGANDATAKDTLENRLHSLVCAGTMTLAAAQQCIAVDWIACAAATPARLASTPAPTTALPTSAPTTQPTAAVTTQIVSVTSPVSRNSTATLVARAAANASCTIVVTYNSGPSQAQGLVGPKTADASGAVSWTWAIGPTTAFGTYPIRVTCAGASASATFTVQ